MKITHQLFLSNIKNFFLQPQSQRSHLETFNLNLLTLLGLVDDHTFHISLSSLNQWGIRVVNWLCAGWGVWADVWCLLAATGGNTPSPPATGQAQSRPGTVETLHWPHQQGKWPGPARGSDLHLPPPLTLAGPLAAVLHALKMPVAVCMVQAALILRFTGIFSLLWKFDKDILHLFECWMLEYVQLEMSFKDINN